MGVLEEKGVIISLGLTFKKKKKQFYGLSRETHFLLLLVSLKDFMINLTVPKSTREHSV